MVACTRRPTSSTAPPPSPPPTLPQTRTATTTATIAASTTAREDWSPDAESHSAVPSPRLQPGPGQTNINVLRFPLRTHLCGRKQERSGRRATETKHPAGTNVWRQRRKRPPARPAPGAELQRADVKRSPRKAVLGTAGRQWWLWGTCHCERSSAQHHQLGKHHKAFPPKGYFFVWFFFCRRGCFLSKTVGRIKIAGVQSESDSELLAAHQNAPAR